MQLIRTWLAFALVALSLAGVATGAIPTGKIRTYGPQAYASPSGETLLHVLPMNRRAAGPSTIVLTQAGVERWRRTVPLTFIAVVVHDSGAVVGYGRPDGVDPPTCMADTSGKRQEVALVSPNGDYRVLREWVSPRPIGQLRIVEDADEVVIRTGEGWWRVALDVSDARLEALPYGTLIEPRHLDNVFLPRAPEDTLVSGTPLRLITSGERAVLVDAQRRPVWTRRFEGPAVGACWGVRVFAVGNDQDARAFRVEELGGWSVTELAPADASDELDALESVVSSKPKRSFDLTLPDGAQYEEYPRQTYVDPWGRTIALEKSKPKRLLAFGRSGQLELEADLTGRPDRLRYISFVQAVSVDAARTIVVDWSGGTLLVHPDGRWTAPTENSADRRIPFRTVAYVPGSDARWVLTSGELARFDALGRVELVGLRRPDGGRLGLDGLLSAASDGGLAVLDEKELHVYAPDGSPRGTFTIATPRASGPKRGVPPAFDGRRAAWLEHNVVRCLDVETGHLRSIPRAPSEDAAVAFVDGELYVACPKRGRVDVFEVP